MKVLLSLLKEFAPIAGEPDLISEQLSELGLAVEETTRTGEHLECCCGKSFGFEAPPRRRSYSNS